MARSGPAEINGLGRTVTTTESLARQPPAETIVTRYIVVSFGEAIGARQSAQESPSAGLHSQAAPSDAESLVLSPPQIVISGPASAAGWGRTVTSSESVAVHPVGDVAVTL